MDYLWTPWRYHYITAAPAEPGVCVFCRAAAADDRQALVVHRAIHNFVILNRFPYTSGHVMVVPFAHIATIEDLPEPALAEMMCLARDAVKHLRTVYRPHRRPARAGIGRDDVPGARRGEAPAHRLSPRWMEPRHEPGPERRRRYCSPRPHARPAALGWRHRLHHHCRRDPRSSRGARNHLGETDGRLQGGLACGAGPRPAFPFNNSSGRGAGVPPAIALLQPHRK